MVNRINMNTEALKTARQVAYNAGGSAGSVETAASVKGAEKNIDSLAGPVVADLSWLRGMSLGYAIDSTNEAINITQVADSALKESANIIDLIKSKIAQAAQDGQNSSS